jgi:hypothetical protein
MTNLSKVLGCARGYLLVLACALAVSIVFAESGLTAKARLPEDEPPTAVILEAAARNGAMVLSALRKYICFGEFTVETVGNADTVTGKYYRSFRLYHDRFGARQEKVFEERSDLPKDTSVSLNTIQGLTRIYEFLVTPETLARYDFNYIGRERVDEIETYVFDVSPRSHAPDFVRSPDRYLRGRIWIDEKDCQVVKVAGEVAGDQKQEHTPRFETYFQNYDKYWFPAYTSADDRIWSGKYGTRVLVRIRYTGYKKDSRG